MTDDDDLPEFQSGYASGPGWYWRIAFWLGGWRGEVRFWVALFLTGLLLGLLVGFVAGTTC